MSDVLAVVEGPTEQAFVRDVLAPFLASLGVYMSSRLSGHRVRHGGVGKWASTRSDIIGLLKERDDRVCTTMFDFYRLPSDWPGRQEAARRPWEERAVYVEALMGSDISEHMGDGFRDHRFLPYIQLHEFEALLFVDTQTLAATLSPLLRGSQANRLQPSLDSIMNEFECPEAINDRPDLSPSKRILGVAPTYRKSFQGPVTAARIGLDNLRATCPHFDSWVARLMAV